MSAVNLAAGIWADSLLLVTVVSECGCTTRAIDGAKVVSVEVERHTVGAGAVTRHFDDVPMAHAP